MEMLYLGLIPLSSGVAVKAFLSFLLNFHPKKSVDVEAECR